MLHLLKRHPIPVRAFFDFTLAMTFAFPGRLLRPLLYPGLVLDQYGDHGFIAVAMVQTREMRPEFLPRWLGGKFFLTGYRIFARYRTPAGRQLRGLQVLRSDTDRNAMVGLGNLFTHYHYSRAAVQIVRSASQLSIAVETPGQAADLSLTVDLGATDESLPSDSIFPDARTAKRFAGPMPYTFSYEPQTRSIVRIEGQRQEWHPRLVPVDLQQAAFFRTRKLSNENAPVPSSAFFVERIPYRWDRGIVEPLRFGEVR
jgi:hypothetical protein